MQNSDLHPTKSPYLTPEEEIVLALKATICKAHINLSDTNREVYSAFDVTIAQHPSETSVRLMARLLAFCLHYDEELSFTKGLSTDSEPEIWKKSATDIILSWIDLGFPSPERIKKASRRAEKVNIYSYQQNGLLPWLKDCSKNLPSLNNLVCTHFNPDAIEQASVLHSKNMQFSVFIDGNDIWLSNDTDNVHISYQVYCNDGIFSQ